MKQSNTTQRLKEIMRDRNLRQVDILNLVRPYSEKYGVKFNKSDLSQYIAGKTEPGQDKLAVLSMALNVSEAWLMGYNVPLERISEDSVDVFSYDNVFPITTQKLPLLGDIACGEPRFANENRESYAVVGTNVHADFCLKAHGDSMINARIFDGDIVFIRRQSTVENGDIAAVIIGDEATLKRVFFYKDSGKLLLNPENPNYEPLMYVGEEINNIKILGKAVAFQSDL